MCSSSEITVLISKLECNNVEELLNKYEELLNRYLMVNSAELLFGIFFVLEVVA